MEEVKYIPGDLVKINPFINKLSTDNAIMKVVEVDTGDSVKVAKYDGTDLCQKVKINDIVPIPLTTKILTKNQWWADGVMENQAICPFCRWLRLSVHQKYDEYYHYVCYGKEDINVTIRFIHQLQHLLFGLGFPMDLKV